MNILTINIFLVLIESLLFFPDCKQENKKIFFTLVFLQLFILHAFLNPFTMPDLPGYVETFELFSKNSLDYSLFVGYAGVKMEVGWIFLCKILSILTDHYIILLLTTSLVIVGAHCYTIYKFSTYTWLSLFIFLCTNYNQSLFVLRQHTAMALCLLSLIFVLKNNLKLFLLVIFLAVSLHTTALIFLPVYFLYNRRITIKSLIGIILAAVIIKIFSASIFNWFFANTWYNSYLEKEGSNYTGFFIMLCSFTLFVFAHKGKLHDISPVEKLFFVMALIGLCLSFIGVGFSPTNRLLRYYNMGTAILIPLSIRHFGDIRIRILLIAAVLFFFALLCFSESNQFYVKDYELIF